MFCPQCGNEVAESQVFCQHCGSRLVAGNAAGVQSPGRTATPWEDRETVGFMNGLLSTVKGLLFSPTAFFRRMPVTGGLSDPLMYSLIIGMTGLMFLYFWDALFHDSFRSAMITEMHGGSGGLLRTTGSSLFAVLTPFFFIFCLFVMSGMLHLFLFLVRGARAGFEATFRVVSYSVSPFILLILPLCGTPLMVLSTMILATIGLKEAHEIPAGKAVFAVFLPFFLSCGMLLLAVALFLGTVAASFGTMMQMYR